MRTLLLVLLAAALPACAPQGCQAIPPVLPLLQELPAQSGAKYGGHKLMACSSTATVLPAIPVETGAAVENGNATEFFFFNPSPTVTVRLISFNGEADASGMPMCDAAGCVRGISLKTPPANFKCKSDGATVNVFLLGLRFE